MSPTMSPTRDNHLHERTLPTYANVKERSTLECLLNDLTRANAGKDELLGLISHELRTPVTIVVGLARVLARRCEVLDNEVQTIVKDLSHSSRRLQSLIENMLLLASTASTESILEPVSLQHLAGRAVREVSAREQIPDSRIRLAVAADLPPVLGHSGWIEQILDNLLSNALKYTEEDSPIELLVRADGQKAIVEVGDRGPGIQADEAEKIFEPFYRLQKSSGKPGFGLGLAVCKRLAELQSGSIAAVAREGGGTTFRVEIPLVDERQL